LLARPAEQIVGASLSQFISENEKPAFTRLFNSGLAGKSSGEIAWLSPENEVRYFHLSFSPLPTEVTGDVCMIVSDFTERKQAEELRISEEKYKAVFEQSGVGKSMTSVSDGKMKMNKAFCEMLGYSEAELSALNWKTITPADSLERDQMMVDSLLTGAKESAHWEKRYIHKNGNTVWVDISTTVQRDKENNPLFFNTSIIDITKRKRAEEELTESNNKFRAIFENNSAAMAIISSDTTLVMVNDEYCKMSGYTRDEVIGTSWTKQIPPEDLERLIEYNRRRQIDPQDAPDKYEFTFYRKNGEILNAFMSVSMFNRMIIASFVDITPRIRAEQDLLKKMDELLQFKRLTVDRELKMIELKKEVNELLKGSGKNEKYRIVE
jgi:PAS domain S-box-containing protein